MLRQMLSKLLTLIVLSRKSRFFYTFFVEKLIEFAGLLK